MSMVIMPSESSIQPKPFDFMNHETPAEDLAWLANPPLECLVNGIAIEVGSWAGMASLSLTDTFTKVYCIDHWQGNPNDQLGAAKSPKVAFQTFCRNVGNRLFRSIIPCVGHSLTYAQIWPFPVDLVFIDAGHDYADVKSDILAWKPHVRSGGLLCGHDYGVIGLEGVKRAVDELLPEAKIGGRTIWWERMP